MAKASAEFDAHVANELLKLSKQESGLVTKDATLTLKGAELKEAVVDFGKQAMSETVDAAGTFRTIENIDEVLATFMQAVDQAMQALADKSEGLEKRANRKPIGGQTRREGGKLVADVEFDDGSKESISAVRESGGLKIVPE